MKLKFIASAIVVALAMTAAHASEVAPMVSPLPTPRPMTSPIPTPRPPCLDVVDTNASTEEWKPEIGAWIRASVLSEEPLDFGVWYRAQLKAHAETVSSD